MKIPSNCITSPTVGTDREADHFTHSTRQYCLASNVYPIVTLLFAGGRLSHASAQGRQPSLDACLQCVGYSWAGRINRLRLPSQLEYAIYLTRPVRHVCPISSST